MIQLYIEVPRKTAGTELIEASVAEQLKARIHYKRTGECSCYLVYYKAGFIYDERICGVCGKHVAFI